MQLVQLVEKVNKNVKSDFILSNDGILEVLEKAHSSRLVVCPGGKKIYKDLK